MVKFPCRQKVRGRVSLNKEKPGIGYDARSSGEFLIFLCDLRDLVVGEHAVVNPHVIQMALETIGAAGE